MSFTWKKIASAGPLASDQDYIEFAGIPTSYTHLMVLVQLGSPNTGIGRDDMSLTFSNLTRTNYNSYRNISNDGAGVLTGYNANLGSTLAYPNAGNANYWSYFRVVVPNYASTSHNKMYIMSGGYATATNDNQIQGLSVVRNTNNQNAVTSIYIEGVFVANLEAGSSAYLYGLSNS